LVLSVLVFAVEIRGRDRGRDGGVIVAVIIGRDRETVRRGCDRG
jgi:hypothetical protein